MELLLVGITLPTSSTFIMCHTFNHLDIDDHSQLVKVLYHQFSQSEHSLMVILYVTSTKKSEI